MHNKKIKVENFINDDLDSNSLDESGNRFDNKSDSESNG